MQGDNKSPRWVHWISCSWKQGSKKAAVSGKLSEKSEKQEAMGAVDELQLKETHQQDHLVYQFLNLRAFARTECSESFLVACGQKEQERKGLLNCLDSTSSNPTIVTRQHPTCLQEAKA
eukprot:1155150-Pelagomonas_calceolata.AAC.19